MPHGCGPPSRERMLKKFLLSIALFVGGVSCAYADQPTYEVTYDTFTSYGVWVTSGSTTELTDWSGLGDSGFKPARITGYRFQNQGATALYYGNVEVSTNVAAGTDIANLGTKLDADDSSVEQVGSHTTSGQAEIYAQAEDSGGATQLPVNVTVYGVQ